MNISNSKVNNEMHKNKINSISNSKLSHNMYYNKKVNYNLTYNDTSWDEFRREEELKESGKG